MPPAASDLDSGGAGLPEDASGEFPSALRKPLEAIQAAITEQLIRPGIPGISEGLAYQLESGGKRLRPALTLWLNEELGGDPDHVLPFALAVELLHNVFLVHDDIEDGDTYRRGRATLWTHLGLEVALNVADYMLAEAYRLVGESQVPDGAKLQLFRYFSETFQTTVEGQARDLVHRGDPQFTLRDYHEIIRRKTGRYLALGWVGAALAADKPIFESEALWEVGDFLGPAFQIQDDLLDLTAGKGRGGEIGCDIREGKPSFLFAFALERGNLAQPQRQQLLEIISRPREETSSEDVSWVVELYESLGAVQYGRDYSREQTEAGLELFRDCRWIPSSTKSAFEEIAHYFHRRQK